MSVETEKALPGAKNDSSKDKDNQIVTCGKIITPTRSEFILSMIVLVWVSHKDQPIKEVLIYAVLDAQSDVSFVLDQTCEALKCPTEPTSLQITTMTSTSTSVQCDKVHNLLVRGLREDTQIELPMCYTRQDMPINCNHISLNTFKDKTVATPRRNQQRTVRSPGL